MAEDADIGTAGETASARTVSRTAAAFAVVLALLAGSLWLARRPIADHLIARALRQKGITGRYDLVRVGFGTQRLEHLALGDPAHPDLTARGVEIEVGYGLAGVRLTGLRAQTVRIAAREHDGAIDLGSFGRLMRANDGKVRLPNLAVDLQDVRLSLATNGGMIGLALAGAGNLRSGFSGRFAASAARLGIAGCTVDGMSAQAPFVTFDGQVEIKGPVNARVIVCTPAAFRLDTPRIAVDLRSDPALEDISGAFALSAAGLSVGEGSAERLSGLLTFKGSGDEVTGNAALSAEHGAFGFVVTGPLRIGGPFAARPRPKDQVYSWSALLTAEGLRPGSRAALARMEIRATQTAIGPLTRRLGAALRKAAPGNRLSVSARVSGVGQRTQLLVSQLDFAAANDVHVALDKGRVLTFGFPENATTIGKEE